MVSNKGQERLSELKVETVKMARFVQNVYNKTRVALVERNEHKARDVVYSDSVIDNYQLTLSKKIIALTGTLSLTGKELRFISMAMNILNTLESIGDKCVDIAERSKFLSKRPPIGFYESLKTMFDNVGTMLRGAIDNLINPSFADAQRICFNDDAVDSIFSEVEKEIIRAMEESDPVVERGVYLIIVFRMLEEIADLCTNLIEYSVYIETGKNYKCIQDKFAPVDDFE